MTLPARVDTSSERTWRVWPLELGRGGIRDILLKHTRSPVGSNATSHPDTTD